MKPLINLATAEDEEKNKFKRTTIVSTDTRFNIEFQDYLYQRVRHTCKRTFAE